MATAAAIETNPNPLQGLARLSAWRQTALLVALAGSVALGVGVALWSQTPTYSLLYANLSGRDAQEVMNALEQAGVTLRIDSDSGAVLVPAKQVHQARLKLAALGLPKGTDLGFELLDKKRGFGTSQFMERARYQRALEVELARTIAELNNVLAARVHLAMPRQSVFLKSNRRPTASVLVQLVPGRQLDAGQPGAIAHLVAAAIANLEPSEVRVVDARGRLLTAADPEGGVGLSERQLDYLRRVETRYIKRIEDLLAPVVGPDSVNAQVVAELDFSVSEQSQERFDPQANAVRSEQVLEERGGGAPVGGVPGALSNQPPADATAPETTEAAAGGAAALSGEKRTEITSTRRTATRNFELDRTVSHLRRASGSIVKLSVAVVIDDRTETAPDGTITATPRTPEELERFTALVKDAVGFDAERGDSVNVVNAAFTRPGAPEPLPPLPLWKRPWVWDAARQAGGALVVLLVAFGVLRPMMRNLVGREVVERQLEQRAAAALPAPEAAPSDRAMVALPVASSHEENLEAARALVHDDPRRVASVVRNWVTENA